MPEPVQAIPAPPPPPPLPEARKPENKPVKAAKPPQKMQLPQKKALAPSAPPMPEQHLSEERSDHHGAIITFQPLPKIPDELRKEAFRTVAVARFHVAADNSAAVELVTPSQNPRLNHILMDTLRTWRFTSATENGKPVASTFTIRVHFAVE
jgi:protein TonB